MVTGNAPVEGTAAPSVPFSLATQLNDSIGAREGAAGDIDTLNAGSRSISTVWQFHIGSHIIRAVALVQFQGILRIGSSKGGVGDGHHRILNTAQVPVDTVFSARSYQYRTLQLSIVRDWQLGRYINDELL